MGNEVDLPLDLPPPRRRNSRSLTLIVVSCVNAINLCSTESQAELKDFGRSTLRELQNNLDFSSPPRPTAGEANGEDGDGDAAAENKVSQALISTFRLLCLA
ncbi:uncharacterized protein LOC126590999 [Malus sylvestris]|uniref:uncharacterized protein LOC126590999 n=1 Tax=Malus sylvestris TaxID=3752 RepID=UPI0021ACEA4D|nr:uncharacterized protein LOC126590999 [Malus sylvestris]